MLINIILIKALFKLDNKVKNKKFNTHLFLVISLFFFSAGCSDTGDNLNGVWENDFGQTFVFNDDNSALWIFESRNIIDTFNIKYKVDYYTDPVELDLYGFKGGPLTGKTLFGIVKFEKNSLTCEFEAGYNEDIRPKEFDNEHIQTYFRKVSDF